MDYKRVYRDYILFFHSLMSSLKSFIKANSLSDLNRQSTQFQKIDRLDSLRGSADTFVNETFVPLSNVR
jgi:hypothetical protein